jgi:crotonobetainyl-CoA:carnitine CoA-transferase CaiB-like acyl-CoA transferase
MATPLAGIRVVEYRAGIAAATAGLLLRDAGAEVIKVEPPAGDASRIDPGHRAWNRGKQSVVLDERDPRLAGLLSSADVVLLGGGLQEIPGWSPESDQIVCSAPPYADAEPFRQLPENDALASALAGVLAGTGAYRPGPAFSTIPTLSYSAGALMASGVAAALFVRQKTGRGQNVSVPWPTLGAYFAGYQASESDRIPYVPSQGGASPVGLSLGWRPYEASDGWMGVACANPVFFQRLCVALDRADVISDPRFQTAPFVFNPADRDELTNIIAERFRTKTREEWTGIFEANAVPAAPLMTREQFVASDLVQENGMIVRVDDPEVGQVDQVAVPYELSGCEFAPPAPAPMLGADTDKISRLAAASRRATRGHGPLPGHPLAGVRILDLTGFLAGPTAGRLLAELGAEVIKLEPPEGEGFRGAGLSCAGINMGKKSVAIDMAKDEGRKLRDRLIESADVIMHALIPGAPEKLGLDYESVRAINPRIIYCWISGFGKAKKWRPRPSFDLLLQALSGQMFALGSKEQPIYSSIPMADLYGGMLSVYGISLSLYLREINGEGRAFTTNQVASSMAAQNGQFVRYAGMPQPSTNGNSIGTSASHRYYKVTDGWVMLAVENGDSWARLVEAARPAVEPWRDWTKAKDESAEGPLATSLAAAFSGLTRKEVVEQFTAKSVPVAPVVVVREDRITNEYFRSLGVLVEGVQHDLFGTITTVGDFFTFSATPSRRPDMAQWIGEHNREVLKGLGYSEAEMDHLAEARVIASPEFRLARL